MVFFCLNPKKVVLKRCITCYYSTKLLFKEFDVFVRNKAKGRISKRVLQENKPRQIFPKNEHFLPPDTNTYVFVSGGKKCSLFGKFIVRCFLETPVLRFTLLPYYQFIKQFPSFSEWIVKVVFPAPLPPTTSILNGCFICTSICDYILLFNNNQSTHLLLL